MELLDRIAAALATDAPTTELTALLIEAGGEQCWRRPRLIHRLTAILHAKRPPMASSTTHRFKAGFAHKDFSGFPLVIGSETRLITAKNLTNEDVPLLKQYGGGHLIEPIPAKEAAASEEVETVNTGILQTAVEQDGDTTIIKHSSGGPDDLPITAPAAEAEETKTPDKKPEPVLKPAPKTKEDEKKHK